MINREEYYKVTERVTRLKQYCYIMTVSDLLEQPRNKPDNINKGRYKLLTACSKLVEKSPSYIYCSHQLENVV